MFQDAFFFFENEQFGVIKETKIVVYYWRNIKIILF